MGLPEPSNDYEASGSKVQRIAIGAGALIVVLLTVIVAIFLTLQDLPSPEGEDSGETPVAVIRPTETTVTPVPLPTFATIIPSVEASDTPVPTPTISPTALPVEPTATTIEPTIIVPTDTPLPPPSLTPTAILSVPTNTPLPAPAQPPAAPGGACQPPAGWTAYVAQIGDTYASLAARTGTTVFELQRVNCPETATLNVGQTVYLPGAPASVPGTSTPRPDPTEARATATPIIPEITEVAPGQVNTTGPDPVIITILGKNFRARDVEFRVELRGTNGAAILELREPSLSDTSFEAIVPPSLPVGTYDLIVTNASDRADIRPDAVEVVAAP